MKINKTNKTALLFGATGLVGRHLLDFLLLHGAYSRVKAFTRRPLELEHPKLETHIIDFDRPESFRSLLRGQDLFISLGTTIAKAGSQETFRKVDYDYPLQIAQAALANGVNQLLLVSSVGADPDSLFFYSRVKGELEEAVKKLDFWAVHIFQPSVLLGQRNENRWGEELAGKIGKVLDRISGGLLTRYRPIEADYVAKAMVHAAQGLEPGVHVYPSHWLQKMAEREEAILRQLDK